MEIKNEVDNKLKILRETEEWAKAVETAKQDPDIIESGEKQRKRLEESKQFKELQTQVEDLSAKSENFSYTLAWDNGREYDLEKAYFSDTTVDIDKVVSELIERRAINHAKNKTGFIDTFYLWTDAYNELNTEVKARLSITNLDNFDEIVEATCVRFDTDEIVQQLVDNSKDQNLDSNEPCADGNCCSDRYLLLKK
jgi:hypothetical protein